MLLRRRHNISKPSASAGDGPVDQTHGEPDEHGDIRVMGDHNKGGWRETMDYVSSSTWGSIPKPPNNEPDTVMAFPVRETSYARRTIPTGAAAVEVPLDDDESFRDARIVSDDCGNNVFGSTPPRVHGGEGENQSKMMTVTEFQQESLTNGVYIGTGTSSVVTGSPVDISPEDWLYVEEVMLDPNIN